MPLTWLSPLGGEGDTSCRRRSPVARDYPSRALSDVFQAAALRLFYQGTRKDSAESARGKGRLCSSQLLHRSKSVNNLGINLLTGCSRRRSDRRPCLSVSAGFNRRPAGTEACCYLKHRACKRALPCDCLHSTCRPRDLPIYELESAVVASLRAQGRLIVQAPTGSGKSTQIPQMLLAARPAWRSRRSGRVATAAARRTDAREARGGGSRHEPGRGRRISDPARVTGQRADADPFRDGRNSAAADVVRLHALRGISAIVFDEFHERHLYGDISLARAMQIQQTTRPDLKIIVMSATLDAGALKNYLAPVRGAGLARTQFPRADRVSAEER